VRKVRENGLKGASLGGGKAATDMSHKAGRIYRSVTAAEVGPKAAGDGSSRTRQKFPRLRKHFFVGVKENPGWKSCHPPHQFGLTTHFRIDDFALRGLQVLPKPPPLRSVIG